MGIEINVDVDFNKVEQERWESVYRETLKLIDLYPFMDKIVDKDSYTETMVYADRTRERYLTPWYPEMLGWYTIGDLQTFEHAESFMLVKDINFYKRNGIAQNSGDIYFSLINGYDTGNPEIGAIKTSGVQVFAGKTQGYDYHKYLLGIAALIEDRLKPHAVVSGDITLAQIQESVHWVNEHIERKISLPDRCSYTQLLSRLKKQLKTEAAQIEALFDLLLYPGNNELGVFIRNSFSRGPIVDYWKKELRDYTPNTIGMSRTIKEYLNMHFCLEDLCDILAGKGNEKFMTPKECILAVLRTGILDKKPQKDWLSLNNQTDSASETIPSVFGKMCLHLAGYRDSTTLSMEEYALKNVFYSAFKQKELVDKAFAEHKNCAAKNDPAVLLEGIMKKSASAVPEREDDKTSEQYDIEKPLEIIYWVEGDSLHPDLVENIQKLVDFSDGLIKELKRDFTDRSEDARIQALITCNQYFLIRKKTWDFILANILDDTIFYQFLSLLCIKADEITMNSLIKSVCNNLDFLKHHVLSRSASVQK